MTMLPPSEAINPEPSAEWRSTIRVGLFLVVFTFVVMGGWSALAQLHSGVVAGGALEPSGNRRTVQHLEGGIVREILVRNGMSVKEGDVLIRLDPTRNAATDQSTREQLAIALAMEARLIAQRDMLEEVTFPEEVLALQGNPLIATSINDSRRQFEARQKSLMTGIEVMETQRQQMEKEIQQAVIARKTAENQIKSINTELPVLRDLMKRGLVPVPRVTALERQLIQTQGQLDAALVSHEEAQNKVSEVAARIDQLKQEYRQEGASAFTEVRSTLGELRQKVVISGDALKRGEIHAPVSGTIQGLKVFTVGGVVQPGEPLLDIAPQSDQLVARARIMPLDIDRVQMGADVEIRLPQFMKFQSQTIYGQVSAISRDSLTDSATGSTYYAVEASINPETVPEDIKEKLLAGMTASIIIRTGERTVLAFLVAPIANRLATAMRER
ncbi:HlyD family type I secretion periplasmic adaptor subunit [Terrihabitans sp. B22-R8]|uniref:HlyD family type I secretion periplasmic adaptor subunit n=1 Tax=Terrihabitans sp. B22-R8 TaxID=3425128 RepID=UPI00403D36F0